MQIQLAMQLEEVLGVETQPVTGLKMVMHIRLA